MSFEVFLTADAALDLEELYDHIARNDTPEKAGLVLSKIEEVFKSLSRHPNRGAYPKELLTLGIREFRELFFKPYRVIYRIIGRKVYILLIADGRRDMQSLLQQRLLKA